MSPLIMSGSRRFRTLVLGALLLPTTVAARRHDLHVTQSRVVVTQGVVEWRLRCFTDDLEKGLRAFTRAPTLTIGSDGRIDSLATAYFNATVHVDADGRRLQARLVSHRHELEAAGGRVEVFVMRLVVAAQPKSLTIRDALLFEQFETQQNLVLVLAMPGNKRRSLYFTASDDRPQTITF